MATYVLVPGACHGGWWYEPLAAELREEGHAAYPVTLTGLGPQDAPTGGINLDTHIDDVVRLLAEEDLRDVVLCGHSYAGMVITGVADRVPERIASLVYVDAFVPQDGDSVFSLTGGVWHDWYLNGSKADGFSVAPLPVLSPRATPHPLATLVQGIRLTGALDRVPRREYVYLANFENTPFTATYERLREDPAWHVRSLPIGHNIVADAPDDFRKILLDAA
ncbi:alpha/beta fold hydrolase [Saccharopolyspora spinosa]|uniref:Alpha/beta hydrolase family protein n=1 Tax=Saccharopolyspora spinosa TaxID=60894 RepID=A0A2N3XTW9_SACSN|nr:alpha/beta hydrolase [Saccharopolyspora spinosa]PKW14105.1 alpha/beta hydrolase family protein [Saccharopolyspora spinosa]